MKVLKQQHATVKQIVITISNVCRTICGKTGEEINNFLSDVTLQQVILRNNNELKEMKLSEY